MSTIDVDLLSGSLVNVKSTHGKERIAELPINDVFDHQGNLKEHGLIVDIESNRRDTKGTYDRTHPDMAALILSHQKYGWFPGKRVVVSERADGTRRVLQGHRRTKMAEYVGLTHVPCLVFYGLTPEQETTTIVDSIEAPIGKIGQFREIQMLMKTGLAGRNPIAIRTGLLARKPPHKPLQVVQEYMELSEMPKKLQDIWIEQQRGSTEIPFTPDYPTRRDLYSAMLRDQRGETLDKEGNKIKRRDETGNPVSGDWNPDGGPEFNALWDILLTKGITPKKQKEQNAVNTAGIETMGKTANQADVRTLFLGLAGHEGQDHARAFKKIENTMEVYSTLINFIKDVEEPHVRLMVFGPTTDSDESYRTSLKAVVDQVVLACETYFTLHPDKTTLPECKVPFKPVSVQPVQESVQEPVQEIEPEPEPVQVHTISEGVTTKRRKR